jgi:spore maturation protein CgeB
MKIVVVGDGHSLLHEVEVANSLERLGHKVLLIRWADDFQGTNKLQKVLAKAQYKYIFGPRLKASHRRILALTVAFQPDFVFVYRGSHLTPQCISDIKSKAKCTVVAYNNDNPFQPPPTPGLWRHYLRSIPFYDLVCHYRPSDEIALIQRSAQRTYLLRSWFRPSVDYARELTPEEVETYRSDITFIGHFEPDGRDRSILDLVNAGLNVKLFGPPAGWERLAAEAGLGPVIHVTGDNYAKAITGAKISLCFFSRINKDTYTRRCFEIPAIGSMLLSEHSDDLASLFEEGEEAEYFRSNEELVTKCVRYIQKDEQARLRVANLGKEKVASAGHDVDSRMEALLKWMHGQGLFA